MGIPLAVCALALVPSLIPRDPAPDTDMVTAVVTVGCDAAPPDGGPDFKRDLSTDLANETLPAVWYAQHKLFQLGYLTDNGQCDGRYGDQTKDAVRAFKPRNDLPQSDTIDAATWEKLFDESAQRA